MYEIEAIDLKGMIDRQEEVQIIDIREIHEVDSGEIGGRHIPMAEVMERTSELPTDIPVVIYCKSGARASALVHVLRTEKGMDNVRCLKGGIEAWANQIDPNVNIYG